MTFGRSVFSPNNGVSKTQLKRRAMKGRLGKCMAVFNIGKQSKENSLAQKVSCTWLFNFDSFLKVSIIKPWILAF